MFKVIDNGARMQSINAILLFYYYFENKFSIIFSITFITLNIYFPAGN